MKAKLPKSILKRPPADEDRLLQVIEGKMQKMHEGMERISYPGQDALSMETHIAWM